MTSQKGKKYQCIFYFLAHQNWREVEIHCTLCILSLLIVIEPDVRQTLPAVAGGAGYVNRGEHRKQWYRILARHDHGTVPLGALAFPLSPRRIFSYFTSVTRHLRG